MKTPRDGFVPAAELADLEFERLVWRVNLPSYAPAENIGVNVGRIERLARLAGFESLRIGSYAGETTVVTPGIDSVGRDGSASASMTGAISKAETHQNSIDTNYGELPHEWVWNSGQVLLNTAEIDNRVGERKGSNLRDPRHWSQELNTALARGIAGAAKQNIVDQPSIVGKLRAPSLITGVAVGDVMMWHDPINPEMILVKTLLFQLLTDPFMLGPIFNRALPRDRKWSLVPGVQLDRLAAVGGLSRVLPLIKKV